MACSTRRGTENDHDIQWSPENQEVTFWMDKDTMVDMRKGDEWQIGM